ncbi:hypothetical protein Pcinc_022508 [Petrolisthes cinctipes]|uniref:Uncharacterized protein n=1 Tax=Petrolisthes cinctipes TaxID=88211 RepID=A0AAE1KH07_PETCI|nr:hypothetical protein Pcinc_022508 [Petrolisthes cinctipes]
MAALSLYTRRSYSTDSPDRGEEGGGGVEYKTTWRKSWFVYLGGGASHVVAKQRAVNTLNTHSLSHITGPRKGGVTGRVVTVTSTVAPVRWLQAVVSLEPSYRSHRTSH